MLGHEHMFADKTPPVKRLSCALLGALIVVDVEDQIVAAGAADLEVEGGVLFQLAQEVHRLIEVHRERRATLGKALDRDLRSAEAADRVLEADQLREIAERADLQPDQALEELSQRGLRSTLAWRLAIGRTAMHLAQLLRTTAYLDRLAQRLHSDPRRLPTRLRLDLLQALGNGVERGDAAVVALVRLLQLSAQAADLALALDNHSRKRSQLRLGLRRRIGSLARLRQCLLRMALQDRNRRIHITAAVAEKRPLEATHARHRKGALGRHPVSAAARAAAPRARDPRADSAPVRRR